MRVRTLRRLLHAGKEAWWAMALLLALALALTYTLALTLTLTLALALALTLAPTRWAMALVLDGPCRWDERSQVPHPRSRGDAVARTVHDACDTAYALHCMCVPYIHCTRTILSTGCMR